MNWNHGGARGRSTAAIGGLAALGLLIAGCGIDDDGGFTTSATEIQSMLEGAEAGNTPMYCSVRVGGHRVEMWLRGDGRYKMVGRTDDSAMWAIREDSALWLWSEQAGEGLQVVAFDGELAGFEADAIFARWGLGSAESGAARCRLDPQTGRFSTPPEVTFFTTEDIAAGKYTNTEAQALLENFSSFGG